MRKSTLNIKKYWKTLRILRTLMILALVAAGIIPGELSAGGFLLIDSTAYLVSARSTLSLLLPSSSH